MEILQPGKKNNDDVKHGRLDASADIYDPNRPDPTASERWKSLNRQEKKQFFKDYYLKPLIIGCIILAAISYVVYTVVKPPKKDVFFAAAFNMYIESELEDSFSDDFGDYLGGNPDKEKIYFKSYQDSYLSEMEVDNFFEKRRFDVFLTTNDRFKSFANNDIYMNLEEVLPAEFLEKHKDRLVYYTNKARDKSGKEYPYGLDLKGTKYEYYDQYSNEIEDPIVGIAINTKRKDTAVKFIEYLFEDVE